MNDCNEGEGALSLRPIGFIQTGKGVKFDTPYQPKDGTEERNRIVLVSDSKLKLALRDLEGFERIWLLWWFHKNVTWRPLVLPPRGPNKRRGLFATRSPHRPNPIGLTSVKLLGVEECALVVGNVDLLDGTPILDIKPYLPSVDAFPNSRFGWVEEIEKSEAKDPQYTVILGSPAKEQIAWLRNEWKIDIFSKASEILSRDPFPNRTRRITKAKNGRMRISCGAWRIFYRLQQLTVNIEEVTPGYPQRIISANDNLVPDREAQLSFSILWP